METYAAWQIRLNYNHFCVQENIEALSCYFQIAFLAFEDINADNIVSACLQNYKVWCMHYLQLLSQ